MRFLIKWIVLCSFSSAVFSATDEHAVLEGDSVSPPTIGNFGLSSPQQPGPFLSFGQTLIGRNYLQLSLSTFSPYSNITGPFNNINASLTYGITDNTALYFNFPITADVATRNHSFHGISSGVRDITLQLEQAIYTTGNATYQDQATVVGSMTLPSQEVDLTKSSTGYGAPSYFVGATYNRTYVDWLGFISPGALLTTASHGTRFGSQFLYQAGLGRNILYVGHTSALFGLLELDGQYTEKNQLFGRALPNSGGNVVALTPSLSLATQTLMAQVGVGFPIAQHLFGNQQPLDYFIAANFIWTVS